MILDKACLGYRVAEVRRGKSNLENETKQSIYNAIILGKVLYFSKPEAWR